MQYKTIFFDLDDTLWDTATNSRESLEEVYYKYSFDKYYNTFGDFFNVYASYNLSLWDLYEQHKIEKNELMNTRFYTPFKHIEGINKEKAIEINFEFMTRTSSKSRVIEGAKEILDWVKPNYKLCILSNGFEEVQFKKIESAGLTDYFDKVILSDHVGKNKPHPEIFEYALNQMNTQAEDAIMVGDNWTCDIEGALKSNIDQVWYNPDGDTHNNFEPTYTIQNLFELKDILIKQ